MVVRGQAERESTDRLLNYRHDRQFELEVNAVSL